MAAGQQASGILTHPSGAIGTFVVEPHLFGRSNVPQVCTNHTAPQLDPYGGDSVYPLQFHSTALITKTIQGPGLDQAQWDYTYGGQFGFAPLDGHSWARVDGPGLPRVSQTPEEGVMMKPEVGNGDKKAVYTRVQA